MNTLKKISLVGIAFILSLTIVACVGENGDESAAQTGDTIVIGSVLPLTGDGAAYGLPIQKAAILALEEINAKGGVNGKKIEVIWEDGQCKGESSASAAQKLINIDKVKLILGGVCSSETLGIAPIAEENKVLVFSPASTNPKITEAGDFIFRNSPSDSFQGKVLAEAAYATGAKKAGVIHEQSDYAIGVKDVFVEHFTKLGGEAMAEAYTADAPDLRTQVLKVKAANSDVIVAIPQTPAKGDVIFRELQKQGVGTDLQLVANEVIAGDYELLAKHADFIEGMITADLSHAPESEQFKHLITAYTEKYNESLPYVTYLARAYDAVYLLTDGISAVGYDAEKLRDWLYNLKDWKGAEGTLNFTENGDPKSGFLLKVVRGGKLTDPE